MVDANKNECTVTVAWLKSKGTSATVNSIATGPGVAKTIATVVCKSDHTTTKARRIPRTLRLRRLFRKVEPTLATGRQVVCP